MGTLSLAKLQSAAEGGGKSFGNTREAVMGDTENDDCDICSRSK